MSACEANATASPEKLPHRPCRPQPPPERANAICDESASPGRYRVEFDNRVATDLTATLRTGEATFTFPRPTAYLALDAFRRVARANTARRDPG